MFLRFKLKKRTMSQKAKGTLAESHSYLGSSRPCPLPPCDEVPEDRL